MANVKDNQIFREALIVPIPKVEDYQIVREALVVRVPTVDNYQVFREALIVPAVNVTVSITGNAITSSKGTVAVSGSANVFPTGQQVLSSASSVTVKLPKQVDQPSIQFHPVLKPLDFSSRPLTQAGRRLGTGSFLAFLTTPGANRSLSIPLGARNQPIPGKLFTFSLGGTITLGAAGSLVITPFYGADISGVSLGQSLPNAYPANTNPLAWRLHGQIIFQDISFEPGLSDVLCGGSFTMNTQPATVVLFGSSKAIQVDASKITRAASGALNFAATFAPFTMNASLPSITTRYAVLRTI